MPYSLRRNSTVSSRLRMVFRQSPSPIGSSYTREESPAPGRQNVFAWQRFHKIAQVEAISGYRLFRFALLQFEKSFNRDLYRNTIRMCPGRTR
jgi:hypothetical protein